MRGGYLGLLIFGFFSGSGAGAEEEDIRASVEFLSSVGSRVAGYEGCARAADFVEQEFCRAGVKEVWREEFRVTIPVDQGFTLVLEESGEVFPVWGIWPNLVCTSTLPAGGLRAPMIYGGRGDWAEFNGKELDGRIVLMEFDSWDHWLRAASLGSRAVVFIEPEAAGWRQANAKFSQVPLEMPRFWMDRQAGERLRQRLQEGEAQVLMQGRMHWEQRPAWNILGVVPGHDPDLKEEVVVVEAYYDGASVVPALAPSAESACSMAGLLELARHLQAHPPARTIVLAATSAHFQNRQGIAHLLRAPPQAEGSPILGARERGDIKLFISLDLSSGNDQLGIWNNSELFSLKRLFVPLGRRFTGYAAEAAPLLGRAPGEALVNGISPLQGMDWSAYVPGGVRVNSEIALKAGLLSLALVTVHDARLGVDTPLDRSAQVNYYNLERQIALLEHILPKAFDDPALFAGLRDFGPILKDELRGLNVQVRLFGRRGQAPDRPVPNAVVVLNMEEKPHKGVRAAQYAMADALGNCLVPGIPEGPLSLAAYGLDPEGRITLAPDLGQQGQEYAGKATAGRAFADMRWKINERTVVLFPCVAQGIYDLVDPHSLRPLTDIAVIDRSGSAPGQYGYALSGGELEPVGMVFSPRAPGGEGEPLRILLSSGLLGYRMLLLNNQGEESGPQGKGFQLGQDRLVRTSLLAARDMWWLDEGRMQTMRQHGIENLRLARLHQEAQELIEQAEEAARERQWDQYMTRARGALGVESRAYPEVVATLNDVIAGLVFFLALVIPAAFFGERLLFAAADIHWQLAGFTLLVLLIWLAISQVHPAFALAHPVVILLSFAIMGMAIFVVAMVLARFNKYVKEYHGRRARVQETDISRVSASYTAFMLGISNMRRRQLRTGLTLATLVLLTFTVLSFTAFEQQIRFVKIPLAYPAPYAGVLVRDLGWNELALPVLDYVRSHFGQGSLLGTRSWYFPGQAGGQSPRPGGRTYVEIEHNGRSVKAYGLLGLTPEEAQITEVGRALQAGSWFSSSREASCLVPEEMAQILGIGRAEVGQARVRIFGEELLVRGIVDSNALQGFKDLDGEPLTPVDFQAPAAEFLALQTRNTGSSARALTEIRPAWHLSPANVLILPHETLREAGGSLRSIAIRFGEGAQGQRQIEELLMRVGITLFAGLQPPGGKNIEVFSYTSIDMTAVEGLSALFVPIVIAALIVLNAMLGAVYERLREIGIYSSVGLAPGHIALLFVAEALVYAVIGVTLGYLLGQGLGKILAWGGALGGMALNYSSTAAVFSAVLVMGVVLLSTCYPARMAARTAVPDIMRRWRMPLPQGDRWEFQFPFMVSRSEVLGLCGFLYNLFAGYRDESLGTFYVRKVQLTSEASPRGAEYAVQLLLWLAPFDMGVSQYVQVEFLPTQTREIYAIELFIHRLSGQQAFWQRLNCGFANRLRKELLVWHTLKEEARAYHREIAWQALAGREVI